MTTADLAARVAAARRWFRVQGYAAREADGLTVVRTPAHPDTWDANFVLAGATTTPAQVEAAFERDFADASWRVLHGDVLTAPAVEAALALADFDPGAAQIEMVATEVTAPFPLPALTLTPVDAASWPRFAAIVAVGHAEHRPTGSVSPSVAAGLLDARRRRRATCTYWLLHDEGEPAGYGMTAVCPNGLGLIENLYTLPDRRRRGLMSAFIAQATAQLRAAGCDAVFLGARAADAPKRLYARLGFAPVSLTRTWVKRC